MCSAMKIALHVVEPPILRLNRRIRLRVKLVLNILSLSSNRLKKQVDDDMCPVAPSLESKSKGLEKRIQKVVAGIVK
jgi:hypothetical protein